jgi:hypothetical protein
MKHLLLLTVLLISSSVVALEPTLTRQSFGKCYYDDGSIIKSSRCPSRLSTGSNNSSSANGLLMSEESANWRLNFGKKQAEAVSSALTPSSSTVEALSSVRASQAQQNADDAIKNTALADYVSKKYGQEGENLRELIMTGVIDSSNFKVFLD